MGRAIDRLPLDYEHPRGARREIADPLTTMEGSLVLPQLTAEEREERNAAAVRYLIRRGAADLVDVLGLGAEPEPTPAEVLDMEADPKTVVCPSCNAWVGKQCTPRSGVGFTHPHKARRLDAQQRKAAA